LATSEAQFVAGKQLTVEKLSAYEKQSSLLLAIFYDVFVTL
jgi:hypothetical protein